MLKKLIIATLVVFQAGCAQINYNTIANNFYDTVENESFTANLKNGNAKIEFMTVVNIDRYCGSLLGYKHSLACAVWTPGHQKCMIYSAPKTHSSIIGHEVRHCFEGHFH